jgi:dipeptidyl-peptidase 4
MNQPEPISTTAMAARYRRAQALEQGFLSRLTAINTGLFPHWIDKSDCFWYEHETRTGCEYRLVDAAARSIEPAFDHTKLAIALANITGNAVVAEDLPLDCVELLLSPRCVEFSAFGRRWRFLNDQGTCEQIAEEPLEGLASPDGQSTVFVRDYNLWLLDVASGRERALTVDGEEDLAYGVGQSLAGPVQAVWSPDSKRLFMLQRDTRGVQSTPMVEHVPRDGSLRPTVSWHKVSYPGDKNVETNRLLSIDIASGEVTWADHAPLPLCRLGADFFSDEGFGWWANDNRRAFFVSVAQGGQRAQMMELDTETGNTRLLFEETAEVGLLFSHNTEEPPVFLPLPEANELIWFTECSGWAHLYLYNLDTGECVRPLTSGDWLVRDILHVDTERRELFVQTAGSEAGRNPYYRDIRRINIDSGESVRLAADDCDYVCAHANSATQRLLSGLGRDVARARAVSPGGSYVAATRTRVDQLPVHVLMDRRGKEILRLETAELTADPALWRWPEPVQLTAADGKTALHAVVFRPSDYSPKRQYPVVELACALPGAPWVPHGAFINAPFAGLQSVWAAAYAELGFIVVMLEGRGGPQRSRAFREVGYGWAPAANAFDDRIAGLRQLAESDSSMDLSRVGVVAPDGVNGPVHALLEHPDFYSVGAMVCFQDTRLLMVSCGETMEGVDRQLPVDPRDAESLAGQLQGKLLLIHGMRDAFTPPANTFRLVGALQRANKDFDMLMLPHDGHEISSYAQRRIWDYLVRHLLDSEPPKAFKLKTGVEVLLEALTNKMTKA